MGVDFSYPNPTAVDKVVDFAAHDKAMGYPDGTSYSAVQLVRKYSSYKEAEKHMSQQQKDAYNNWYSTDIIETDHWKKLVADYKAKITDPKMTKPPGFTDKPDWIDETKTPTNSGFNPPGVNSTFKGDPASTGGMAVNTAALEWFANEVLGKVVGNDGVIKKTALTVDAVNPKPGGFARAELLRQAIVGATGADGGIKMDTRDMLYNIEKSLDSVRLALLEMAKKYKDTEELNKLSTADLDTIMGDAFKGLQGLNQYGSKDTHTDGG